MLEMDRIVWQTSFGRGYWFVVRKVTETTNSITAIVFHIHWCTLAGKIAVETAYFCYRTFLYRRWLCTGKRKMNNYIWHEYC